MVTLKVYDSFEKIDALQEEWDEFVESVGCDINMTYDWCRIWWKYYGTNRKLQVFVFRDKCKLVGIIPSFFEKIWLGPVFITAGKIIGTDFTLATVILPICQKFVGEVIQSFVERTIQEMNWDILHIGPISGIFSDFEKLFRIFHEKVNHRCTVKSKGEDVQAYFKLAKSWEKHFGSLSKKKNRDIRRKYRLVDEAVGQKDSVTSQFISLENIKRSFEVLSQMHKKYWQEFNRNGHFGDWPRSKQFHFEMVQRQFELDRLRLLEVRAGSHILGYKYAYKFGNRYKELMDARSGEEQFTSASLGRIIFCEQLKKALKEGVKYIDSSIGKYDHKLWFGAELLPVQNIFITSKKPGPFIKTYIFGLLSSLLNICYYKIWFYRISAKLPFKRRPLWKIWIRSKFICS